MTVYLVIALPKTPYVHRIYMVLANLNIFVTASNVDPCSGIFETSALLVSGPLRIVAIRACYFTYLFQHVKHINLNTRKTCLFNHTYHIPIYTRQT